MKGERNLDAVIFVGTDLILTPKVPGQRWRAHIRGQS